MIEFTIDALPPSQNEIRRQHWTVRHRSAREWRGLVAAEARKSRIRFLASARVTVTYHGPASRDADNYNVKPILDGLIDAGVLGDDRFPFVVELVLRQRPAKKREHRTCVCVESAE